MSAGSDNTDQIHTFKEQAQSTDAGYSLGKFGVEIYPVLVDNDMSLHMSVTAASDKKENRNV